MHHTGGSGSGPANADPVDRVIAMAKKWRQADKDAAATKSPADAGKEYRARQALRDAIDKLP